MRHWMGLCALGLMVGLAGCQKQSPPGGTMKADSDAATFQVGVPKMATHIKAGEQDEIAIKLDRGSDFHSDVKVDLLGVPGMTLTPTSFTMHEGNESQKIVIAVGPEMMESTQVVQVHAEPGKGKATDTSFEVKVGQGDRAK